MGDEAVDIGAEKRMNKMHELKTGPYHTPVYVLFTEKKDRKKYCSRIERILGISDCSRMMDIHSDSVAFVIYNAQSICNGFVIVFPKKPLVRTIVHECFHITKGILVNFAGIKLSDSSEEAFSYFISDLVVQIIKLSK